MHRYIFSAIPVLYLFSTLIFQSFWNQFYQSLGIRFDLNPNQIRLLPLGMNLLAASFGVPSVRLLLRKNRTSISGGGVHYAPDVLSAVSVVLLIVGAARWIIIDPRAISTGVKESVLTSKVNVQDLPEVRDEVFSDAKLRISLKLPENWEVLTSNAIRRAHESGLRSITGRNQAPSESKLPPEIDQFLAIKKYPESYSGYNPSMAFVSYEKAAMKAQGFSSLMDLVLQWSKVGPPYTVISGPSAEKIGGFDGYRVRLKGDFNGVLVQQNILAFETATHYVSATISVQDLKDRGVLEAVIKSITRTN